MEELPSPTGDNHVSSVQHPALFSEAESNPRADTAFSSAARLKQRTISINLGYTVLLEPQILDGVPPTI